MNCIGFPREMLRSEEVKHLLIRSGGSVVISVLLKRDQNVRPPQVQQDSV